MHFKRTSDRILKLKLQEKAIKAGKLKQLDSSSDAASNLGLDYEVDFVKDAVLRTVNQWLDETETSYLVTDKVSAADLAVYHQIKQVCTFAGVTIDANEFSRLAEWYGWLEQTWNTGGMKGKQQFEEIHERI